MAKSELGTKRLCASCGAKFYDLSKDPIVCPKCETVFHPVVLNTRSRPSEAARARSRRSCPRPPRLRRPPRSNSFRSKRRTRSPAAARRPPATDAMRTREEDDVEVADDGAEDDTFLETDEDEGDDVSDIVGGEREDEEDT